MIVELSDYRERIIWDCFDKVRLEKKKKQERKKVKEKFLPRIGLSFFT